MAQVDSAVSQTFAEIVDHGNENVVNLMSLGVKCIVSWRDSRVSIQRVTSQMFEIILSFFGQNGRDTRLKRK